MPRIPKRLLALGGLAAGGAAAASALRKRMAGRPSAPAPSPEAPAQPPTPAAATAPASESAPIAPPPTETPGPSVTAPAAPASTTEQAERADALTPDGETLARQAGGPVDALVERETAAAAAEARDIGGHRRPGDAIEQNPAMAPVYEAGGGEAEGFEQAEADLIENASHGGGGANPLRDAFTPEVEADEATGVSGDADSERVSEVVEDQAAERAAQDAGGSGPGVTHER